MSCLIEKPRASVFYNIYFSKQGGGYSIVCLSMPGARLSAIGRLFAFFITLLRIIMSTPVLWNALDVLASHCNAYTETPII